MTKPRRWPRVVFSLWEGRGQGPWPRLYHVEEPDTERSVTTAPPYARRGLRGRPVVHRSRARDRHLKPHMGTLLGPHRRNVRFRMVGVP